MGIIGIVSNLCSVAATDVTLVGLTSCFKTGYKVVDKVMVPVGIFCISSCVGDTVGEHMEDKIRSYRADTKELKRLIEENRRLSDEIKKRKAEAEAKVHNVFEEQKEVNADGNS